MLIFFVSQNRNKHSKIVQSTEAFNFINFSKQKKNHIAKNEISIKKLQFIREIWYFILYNWHFSFLFEEVPLVCFDYRGWGPGEPSHHRGCVALESNGTKSEPVWKVVTCETELPYMCELKPFSRGTNRYKYVIRKDELVLFGWFSKRYKYDNGNIRSACKTGSWCCA